MHTLSGFCTALLVLLPFSSNAQVNSGSDGHDGAFNPTANVTIDMADHPDGIYQYSSVNIPTGVTVTFIPNGRNTPVVWLVQGNCTIIGSVNLTGNSGDSDGHAGPGGYCGGNGGSNASSGQGPGGGGPVDCASYATLGYHMNNQSQMYGSKFIVPLIGGSGGGGGPTRPGGGGGGAMLVAAQTITLNGSIVAKGGDGSYVYYGNSSAAGSGGAIRLVCTTLSGSGQISVDGGSFIWIAGYFGPLYSGNGGSGRIRIDVFNSAFSGTLNGVSTQGFQPIILPAAGAGIQLSIASIAGAAVPASPSGVLANPDVIIPALQTNPIPVVVSCTNVPLNSEITVIVHPASGSDVQAVGMNNVGNIASSTATVSLNMPRGGGIIYAKCVSGLAGLGANTSLKDLRTKSLAETGWTADGERFAKMEVTAAMGGKQQIAYITESGKRYSLAIR